jgi:hypothetical protein
VAEFMKSQIDATQEGYAPLLHEWEKPDHGAPDHSGYVPPQGLPGFHPPYIGALIENLNGASPWRQIESPES